MLQKKYDSRIVFDGGMYTERDSKIKVLNHVRYKSPSSGVFLRDETGSQGRY